MPLLVSLFPLVILLTLAAIIDARTRKIPNWLNLVMLLGGLFQAIVYASPVTLAGSLLGILCGFAIVLIPYVLGARGGGDLKMSAAVGAWVGALATVQIAVVAALAGFIIVIVQCFLTGRLTQLFRNSTLIVANFANYSQVGKAQVMATGQSMRSVDKPLPYAVPTLIGVVVTILMNLR